MNPLREQAREINVSNAVARAIERANGAFPTSSTHAELIASIALEFYYQGRIDLSQEIRISETATRTGRVSGSDSHLHTNRSPPQPELAGAAPQPPTTPPAE